MAIATKLSKLTEQFQRENEKLLRIIGEARVSNIDELKNFIRMATNASYRRLMDKYREYLTDEVKEGAKQGKQKAETKTPPMFRQYGFEIPDKRLIRAINLNYLDVSQTTKTAYERTLNEVNRELKNSKEQVTVNKAKELIGTRLADKGIASIPYGNNREVPVAVYAEMQARTGRQVAFNQQAIEYAKDVTDLVQCTIIFPTCNVCSMYQGRVYSVSGNNSNYPSLYETALSSGFEVIHPNCRHQFLPYFPEFAEIERSGQAQVDREFSNRPFEDNRTTRNKNAYDDWQERNAKRYDKRMEKLEKAAQ